VAAAGVALGAAAFGSFAGRLVEKNLTN
jgi:hypothetical protein